MIIWRRIAALAGLIIQGPVGFVGGVFYAFGLWGVFHAFGLYFEAGFWLVLPGFIVMIVGTFLN